MSVVENRPDSETKYPTVKEGFLWWEFGVFIFNNLFYFAARDFEIPAVPLSLILVDIPPMIVFVLFFISKYIFSKSDHGDRSLRIYRNRLGLLVGCLIALIIVMPIFILEGDLNVGDMDFQVKLQEMMLKTSLWIMFLSMLIEFTRERSTMKIKRLFYLFPTAFAAFFLAGCTTPDYEKLAAEAAPQIPLTAEQKGYMLGPDDLTPQSTNGWTEAANSELGDFSEGLSQYICNLRDIDSITVYSEPYHHAMEASMLGPVLYQQVKVTKAQPLRDLMFKLKEQVPQCKSKSPFVWKLEANNQYSYDVVDDSKVPNSIVWKMTVKGNDDAGNEHQKLVYIAIMAKGEAMVALVLTGVDYTANDGIKPILDEAMAKVTAK